MNGPPKDRMHPEDLRNMVIFFILAVAIYLAYDHFIMAPQAEALRRAQVEATAQTHSGKALAETPVVLPRLEALGKSPRLSIDNGKIFGSLALQGGRLDDISLHEYFTTLEKTENVAVLSPRQSEFPRYADYGWVSDDKTIPMPGPESVWKVEGNEKLTASLPVTLIWNNGKGLEFQRSYASSDSYALTVTQKVKNNSGHAVKLYPYGLISQTGVPADFKRIWFMHEGPFGWIGDSLAQVTYQKLHQQPKWDFSGTGGWAGITDKYWLVSLVPQQDQKIDYTFNYDGAPRDLVKNGHYQVDFKGPALAIAPGQSGESESRIFIGPKRVALLDAYGKSVHAKNFDLAVDFGWLWFLSKPFFYALHYLGQFTGNLGIAVIVLTIAIRMAVFPLTNISYRSFAKMKKVSPQVMELRKRFGDDKTGLQKELVKLYEREGVNPMAGCFPVFLQIPIFFALYKTFYITIEMRQAPFFGWIHDLSAPDPTSIFNLFGLISWDPPQAMHIGVWPCLMLITMLVQRNLNPPPQDPVQRDMARYFPFFITYVLSRFASGLVIYWTFSALIGVIQQIVIMRALDVPIHLFGQTDEDKKLDKAVAEGPAVHPLAEMAEERAEDALFGEETKE